MDKIYIFGHKSPDTDSVCSAIAYAEIKGENFKPFVLGEINEETKYVLNFFGVSKPEYIKNVEGKKVILVDHNEFFQSADNIEKAEIIEVIDHHKIKFSYDKPIKFLTLSYGSTATIIAEHYMHYINEIKSNDKKTLAGLLLSAILSDTVIFKSPTTTKEDIEISKKLAEIAEIKDIENFGIEIKKRKANLKSKTIEEIVKEDFKDFNFNNNKVGIGQCEVVDLNDIYSMEGKILEYLKNLKDSKNYKMVVFIATDIIKEGSEIYFAGEKEKIEKAFNTKFENNHAYIKGLMSRKKQVVPFLQKVF